MAKISERIERVKDTISSACARVGRDPGEVKLVVVTKSATIEAVKEVIRLGFTNLGENRVQQLIKVSTQVDEFLQGPDGDLGLPEKVGWLSLIHI